MLLLARYSDLKAASMHRINRTFLPYAAIASLTLGGCASATGDFPSLAKRPYEKENPVEEVAVVETLTTTLSADLQKQVDALLSRSGVAHAAFENALPLIRSTIQSAGNPATGSESWANAHTALSRTDSLRADGVAALGEMDRLVARERENGADSGLVALLTAPQQTIAGRVTSENTEVERLTQLIGL
jgi:hypothetical protein